MLLKMQRLDVCFLASVISSCLWSGGGGGVLNQALMSISPVSFYLTFYLFNDTNLSVVSYNPIFNKFLLWLCPSS